ncbi:hypothetical protein GCM10027422_02880 [Hymenobacter arcticus]
MNIEEEDVGRGASLQQGYGLRHRFGGAEYLKRHGLLMQQAGQAAGGQGLIFNE